MGELASNYGHGGVLCAEFLGKNIEAVEQAVKEAQKMLNQIVDGSGPERFWVATMTVCYVGARIANKLGLMQIDREETAGVFNSQFPPAAYRGRQFTD